MYPIGETKLIQAQGNPGSVTSAGTLRPADGMEYILSWLWGWHSDTVVNREVAWLMQVEADVYDWEPQFRHETVGAWTKVFFSSGDDTDDMPAVYLPPRFTTTNFPKLYVSGLAGANYWEIQMCVLERPANLELTLAEWFAHLVGHKLPPGLEALKYRIEHYRGGI